MSVGAFVPDVWLADVIRMGSTADLREPEGSHHGRKKYSMVTYQTKTCRIDTSGNHSKAAASVGVGHG